MRSFIIDVEWYADDADRADYNGFIGMLKKRSVKPFNPRHPRAINLQKPAFHTFM
jgi:hypothetical protein